MLHRITILLLLVSHACIANPVDSIPEFFSEDELNTLQVDLLGALSKWSKKPSTLSRYKGNCICQVGILGFSEPRKDNYVALRFDADHKLTEHGAKDLVKHLRSQNPAFNSEVQRIKRIALPYFLRAIHLIAESEQLIGTHEVRCALRAFVVVPDGSAPSETLDGELGWHWDYCAKKSLVTEIYTDFHPAKLFFAYNQNQPPLPDPRKPASHTDAVPDSDSIFEVAYPVRGALMFPALQGGFIHCPETFATDPDRQGLQLRIVLLVAISDAEWLAQ